MQRADALLAPAEAQPADDGPSAADEPSSVPEAPAVVRGHGPHPATAPEIRPAT
jgi:hypothetical protein